MIVNTGYAWGLGQDIAGGICTDAAGNGVPCPGTIEPPATGSGYQQWASGAITTAPGPLPGTPSQWSLTIPGAPGAPTGSPSSTSPTGTGSGDGSGKDLCHLIFGAGNFGQTMCSGWFWIAVLVVGGIVVFRVISKR